MIFAAFAKFVLIFFPNSLVVKTSAYFFHFSTISSANAIVLSFSREIL